MSHSNDFEGVDIDELEETFSEATKHLERILSTLDQATLLRFYALYKQATVGPCNTPKPGLFALQAKAKWNAWKDIGTAMTTADAMQAYVDRMAEVQPDWQQTKSGSASGWVSVSRPLQPPATSDAQRGRSRACVDCVKDGDVAGCTEALSSVADLNALDADGLALIHWAADRGSATILQVLLLAGAAADGVDADGQTALHYACSVGNADCVRVLLDAGADRGVRDADGQTCAEIAANGEIRQLVE